MKSWLSNLLSEKGSVSSSRLIALITVFVILVIFISKNFLTRNFIDFPHETTYIFITLVSGKIAHKFLEVAKPKSKEE